MDLQMPIMDGYLATQHIRKRHQWDKLPIIAMTAHAMDEERQRCLAAGMNDHVSKPIEVEQLYRTLLRWIQPRENIQTSLDITSVKTHDATLLPAKLPGIDIAQGLKRVDGNRSLYRNLLRRFADTHHNHCHDLAKTIAEDENDLARMMVHSVKGVAGNLGAVELTHHAIILEKALASGSASEKQLQHYTAAMQSVLTGLHAVQEHQENFSSNQPLQMPDSSTITPLLQSLMNELENDLQAADGYLQQIKPLLQQTALGDQYQQLESAMSEYDTDTAFRIAESLMEQLQQ